jgi:Raf kinase inhibitor-like YbhB/YbcL family protein
VRSPRKRFGQIGGTVASLALLMTPLVMPLSMLGACETQEGLGPSAPNGVAMSSITVTSKSFPSGGQIPIDYTCDGKNVSPQLTWSAPPAGTKSIVVMLDDPDAPGGTLTHWIVFDLPADTLTLPEGADAAALGPLGAKVGQNDSHNVDYSGPCPPRGDGMHRVQFHVFALDAPLPFEEGISRGQLDAAMSKHVLGHGALTARFAH